jgi:hypothetical protein
MGCKMMNCNIENNALMQADAVMQEQACIGASVAWAPKGPIRLGYSYRCSDAETACSERCGAVVPMPTFLKRQGGVVGGFLFALCHEVTAW